MRDGGSSHRARMPAGKRITGSTDTADGCWWKGTGVELTNAVTNMMTVAISMTPAHIQPSQRSTVPFRCSPITSALLVSSTTRTSRGGASAPFSTADQKSILTAFKPA